MEHSNLKFKMSIGTTVQGKTQNKITLHNNIIAVYLKLGLYIGW